MKSHAIHTAGAALARPLPQAATEVASPYRWVILFVVWVSFLLSYVDRVAWSSVAAPVGQSMGLSVKMLGAFVTAFYVGYVVANLVAGILTDRLGGRRTLVLALLPLGIATFCFGQVRTLGAGIWVQALMGLAAGADYSAGVKIIAAWFDKDRGRAMGIYVTATSLAVVIANFFVPRISAQYGWPTAFRTLGVCTGAWTIAVLVLVKDAPVRSTILKPGAREVMALFRNRNMIVLSVAGLCSWWAVVGFSAWGNALMTKGHGVDPVTAGSIIAVLGIGAAIAKPAMGWLSDLFRGRRKALMSITLAAYGAALLLFGQLDAVAQLYVLAPVLGIVAFGYIPILMAQVTEVSGKTVAGAASGISNAVWQLGGALSPIAVGQVFGATQSVAASAAVLAAGPFLAAIVVLFLKISSPPAASADPGR